jgi:putative redox protein
MVSSAPGSTGRGCGALACLSEGLPDPVVMTTIACLYGGELRCTARHDPSASLLETDAPRDNQGKGERFSPTDLVATALATCVLTVMGIVAKRHGWSLEGTTARVEKTMTSSGPRRIDLLEVWIVLPAALPDNALAVLREAGEGCPVKRSLEGAVPMRLHWSSMTSDATQVTQTVARF